MNSVVHKIYIHVQNCLPSIVLLAINSLIQLYCTGNIEFMPINFSIRWTRFLQILVELHNPFAVFATFAGGMQIKCVVLIGVPWKITLFISDTEFRHCIVASGTKICSTV